jgi:hypothetical protein
MANKTDAIPETVNFDYLKSSQFRVIHADGAFIGLTQTGLTVNFFTERQPIPRRVVHKVGRDGAIGEEIMEQRVVRDAVIRDTEVSILMSLDVAKGLIDALQSIIKKRNEVAEQMKEQ